jgi:PAS domain S-box-containing protein
VDPAVQATIPLVMQWTHSEDRAVLQQLIERVRRERTEFGLEHRLVMADGRVKFVHLEARPSINERGSLEFLGAVTDITERKLAEENVRRSEASLLQAQRISHTGSWSHNLISGTVTVSPEIHRIFGSNPADNTSSPEFWFDRIHPEDRPTIRELFERSEQGKTEYAADYRIVLPDGTIRHQHSVGHPVLNDAGDLMEFVGTVVDDTEQWQARRELQNVYEEIKQRTDALRRSEGYLAEAQRLTRSGSWAWNLQTGELIWSAEVFRIYEYTENEKPNLAMFFDRIHPEDRAGVEERAERERTQKEMENSEGDFRIVLPDGRVKHLHSIAHPVRDGSGEIREVVGTVMDVTEQWEARANLEKAFEEIKRLKDRLQDENVSLREQVDQAFMFEEIVGASPVLRSVLAHVAKVGPTDSTVLISGETGTGKELIARAIHKRSQRASHAFVSVNCAAIPSPLIASELFGH